jgi:uncharacterized membrane protein
MIKFNFWDIAVYTAHDVHPPMFYWLLKLWSMVFGNNEFALRSMSTFFGGLAILFGYLLTNRLFSKKAARVSLLFMAISPMLVRYGQEARMYTLVATIALAATYVLTYAINTNKKLPWVIYGILVSLGMWVHYFSAIVWIAHWVWRGDIIRRTAKKGKFLKKFFSKEWNLAHIVAIVLYLPWLPFFVIQSFVIQVLGFWIPPVSVGTPLNFLTNAVYYRDLGNTTGWYAFGIIASSLFLIFLARKVYKSFRKGDKQSYRLIMSLAFIPGLFIFAISIPIRSVFIDRYLITSCIGIAIFIGVTLALGYKFLKPKWRYVSTILIAGLMIVGVSNVWALGNYNKNTSDTNQTREIVQAAIAKGEPGQPIIAVTPWIFYEEVFYETSDHPVYFIDPHNYEIGSLEMLKNNDSHKIKDVTSFAKLHPIIWYVGWIKEGDLKAPRSNWKEIQQIRIKDPISGKPEYAAIQFKTAHE